MSKQLQLRRGTTVQNDAFTGAMGELTLDTDTGAIRVHDGTTQGGAGLIDTVVEFQNPTAENNYTWYRKYASGWVEQGGILSAIANGSYSLYTMPVEMADMSYSARAGCAQINSGAMFSAPSTVAAAQGSTTQVRVGQYNTASANMTVWWEVKGMAA